MLKTEKLMEERVFKSLRGRLGENAPLGRESWFGCGGVADLLYEPADAGDLAAFLRAWPSDQPLTVLGGMANTLVHDGGMRGCVLRPGKAFAQVEVLEGGRIRAGAGALSGTVAQAAVKAGIGGLEFLSGVPGMIGGALRMNAGAYGSEVRDVLVEAAALDRSGNPRVFTPQEMNMTYRHTEVPEGTVFTHAVFKGAAEDPAVLRARLKEIKARRQESQPIAEKTGGSTFANPGAIELEKAGLPPGTRAWQLIDAVGGRGFRVGGAQMSEKHCNFMINTGAASAADLENLGEEMRRRVFERFGIDLRWEIKRVGDRSAYSRGTRS